MKFVFRGIFSASLLMFTIESFGYTKDSEVKSWLSANVVFSTGHELSMNQVKQIATIKRPSFDHCHQFGVPTVKSTKGTRVLVSAPDKDQQGLLF